MSQKVRVNYLEEASIHTYKKIAVVCIFSSTTTFSYSKAITSYLERHYFTKL